MRTVVLGALALTSGCNWVFGLDPVRLTDAEIVDAVPDAPLPTVMLSGITPMLNAAGAPTRNAIFVPISPPPTVQYGRRGEALIDTTIDGQQVAVGYEFAESAETWRLVYTLAGGIPHEVHWKPSVSTRPGHAVTLQLTPNDRDPLPGSGTFQLNPSGAATPSNWFFPRVYTTNTWTVDPSPPPDTGTPTQINSNYVGPFTTPMAGAKRTPDPIKDYEVLLEYDDAAAANACFVAKGTAAFHKDLSTGTGAQAPWVVNVKNGNYTIDTDFANDIAVRGNLADANGFAMLSSIRRYQVLTFGPGGAIPLHHQMETSTPKPIPLPIPVGILLAKCEGAPATLPTFSYPADPDLSTVGTLLYATDDLQIAGGGPIVRNGLEQSIMNEVGPYNMDFDGVAFAKNPTVDSASVNITEPSLVPIPAGGTTAALGFEPSTMNPTIDLYEATLYKVNGTTLVPIREFTFSEVPLLFNRDQGQPAGTRYVFAIRVIRGASAGAASGDFTVWQNTQSLGLTHTQAFTLD